MNDFKTVLKEIEKKASHNSWPIIGPEKGKILEWLVTEYKPKRILEVGTFVGYSAILMAQHMPEDGKIISIEINKEASDLAKQNIKKAGFEKNIEVIHEDAMKAIPRLQEKFDLLFLDAIKNEYYNYLLLAENKLNPKAIIVADNVKLFEFEMADYLQYVREGDKFESKNYEFEDDAIEVSWLK